MNSKNFFFDHLIERHTIGESIDYMKIKADCDWDPQYKGLSFKEAIKRYAAFPIIVSDQDDYPGKDKVNNFQEPVSNWSIDTWLAYNNKGNLNEKCYVKSVNEFGICVNKNNCKMLNGQKGNANYYPGSCTGLSDIQCCIKTVTTLKNGKELPSEGKCNNIKDCPTSSSFHSFTQYSDECPGNNDVKLCVLNEYLFAIGVKRLTSYTYIINSLWWHFLGYLDDYIKHYIQNIEERTKYINNIFEHLQYSEDIKDLEDKMNIRQVGFYLGSNKFGTIFEFKGNKWTSSSHELEKDKNGGLVKPNNTNEWDWVTLDLTGYTYKSPDALAKTLEKNYKYFGYFKEDSFNSLCNNSQDFAYWCLKIIRDSKMFVPRYEIDYVKNFFTILPPNSDIDEVKTFAVNVINNTINSCKVDYIEMNIHIEVMNYLFNILLTYGLSKSGNCFIDDFKNHICKGYSVCSSYSYYGYKNTDSASISNIVYSDNGKELCYNFNNSDSDNNNEPNNDDLYYDYPTDYLDDDYFNYDETTEYLWDDEPNQEQTTTTKISSTAKNTSTTTIKITTTIYSYETDTDDPSDTRFNDDQHYNYDEENDDEELNNDKKFWLLVGLGAIWSAITYIFCCHCCHLQLLSIINT